MKPTTQLPCACGEVRLEVQGAPIVSAECHCNSCREAGANLRALAGVPDFLSSNGGTPFVLYRKDRVRLLAGAALLREFRLSPTAKTRRIVATCCNTPIFLEFQAGHWLSLYSCLWPYDARPRPELRTMTRDLPLDAALPQDIPNCRTQSLSFYAKLLGAWIAMGFRVPKLAFIQGTLELPTATPDDLSS